MTDCTKTDLLERVNQVFTCSLCGDPEAGEAGQAPPFSTSVASLFLEHQRCQHPQESEVDCVYCCGRVCASGITEHIQTHFLAEEDLVAGCPHCAERLGQHWRQTEEHLRTAHPSQLPTCPHCLLALPSPAALRGHLLASQTVLYQCPAADCLVKSHSKAALLGHLASRHGGARYVLLRRQYTCAERHPVHKSPRCGATAPRAPPLASGLPRPVDDCQLIELPYSGRVLAKLSQGLDGRLQEDLRVKMAQYARFRVRLEAADGQKQFVCATCQYRSVHSLADVRKHILGCHCSVSTSYTRLCLRASRLDTNSFSLFSDRKLISFANEKLKRAEGGAAGAPGTATGAWDLALCPGEFNGLQLLDDSEQESAGGSTSGSAAASRPQGKRAASGPGGDPAKRAKTKARQSQGAKMRPDSPVPEVGPPLDRSESFDRVIQLNYSWAVLERLVAGQCPERYLPVLRQKMDVYSRHRILLTRRNGKRYFLCSHCPNCSPHGMNDIRKHILGVHARLPERFKSAAMYCSRMNRDNYGLLSDEELLKKNQDMVRWRAAPSLGGEGGLDLGPGSPCDGTEAGEAGEAPLAPLRRAEEDPGPTLETTLETSMGPLETGRAHNNVFLSGEPGSPEEAPRGAQEAPQGRSRRSLVLKARSTCQHHPAAVASGP